MLNAHCSSISLVGSVAYVERYPILCDDAPRLLVIFRSNKQAGGRRWRCNGDGAMPGSLTAVAAETQPQDPGREWGQLRLRELQGGMNWSEFRS